MGLKLRNAVTVAANASGVLFRHRDSFLPVRGAEAKVCVRWLTSRLDGRRSAEQLCASVKPEARRKMEMLLAALREADIVYDSGDDLTDLPASVQPQYEAYVARLERHSPRPRYCIEKLVSSRLITIGGAELTLAVAEAALEAGIRSVTVCSKAWNRDAEMQLVAAAARAKATFKHSPALSRITMPSPHGCHRLIAVFDVAVIGLEQAADWVLLESLPVAPNEPPYILPIAFHTASRMTIGPVLGTGLYGCIRCLQRCYRIGETGISLLSRVRRLAAIKIGARIAMQQFMAAQGESAISSRATLAEVNLHNHETVRRPFVPKWDCIRCWRGLAGRPACTYGLESSGKPMSPKTLLERADETIIDARTGVVARLDEGNLPQLPHHQSVAEWFTPGQRRTKVYTSEIADDIQMARVAALRATLEEYCARALSALKPDQLTALFASGHKPLASSSQDLPFPGLVVSSLNSNDLGLHGFLRCVAKFAHDCGEWAPVAVPASLVESKAAITLWYLRDIEGMGGLEVQRHLRFASEGCEILRFYYDGVPISVVAGLDDGCGWSVGLQDVWLHITATQKLAKHAMLLPEVRFRCSGGSDKLLRNLKDSLSTDFGIQMQAVPLNPPELTYFTPWQLHYAFISTVSETATFDAVDLEASAVPNRLPS